jgi:hypothetical protein
MRDVPELQAALLAAARPRHRCRRERPAQVPHLVRRVSPRLVSQGLVSQG